MTNWYLKKKKTNSLKRVRSGHNRKSDIEDDIRPRMFYCKFCAAKGRMTELYPYKQDAAGNIIMACPIPSCPGSADMENSVNNRLKKLVHQLNVNMGHKQWMDDWGRIGSRT